MHALLTRPAVSLYILAVLVVVPYGLPANLHLPTGFQVSQLRLFSSPITSSPTIEFVAPEINSIGSTEVGSTEDNGQIEDILPNQQQPGLPFQKISEDVPQPIPIAGEHILEDPSGHALDAFYASLYRTEKKEPGAITRITYYGDSVIASDWITSTLRRKFQSSLGDAGHGFILIADAWPGYHHDNIARFASKGWKVSRVVGPYAPDGIYGLGGVSFLADGPGMFATVGTSKSGNWGRAVSRFQVTYAEMPGGGKLSLKLDNDSPLVLPTSTEKLSVKSVEIKAPDGPHKLEIRSLGGGPVRVFHTILERDVPGVVVDAIGIIGCRLRFLDKIDDEHWASELKHRNPNLIVFTYGANESSDSFAYPMDQYEVTARAVLKQARNALPNASCLLVGPMDAADKRGDSMVSRPVIPAINLIQRKLAAELGCGFFDTWKAMGGYGSMGVWIQRGLGGADLIHPTSTGAETIGGWVYSALMDGFTKYKIRDIHKVQ